MLLSDVIAALRLDLFDPSGGPQQRWLDADLQRAIDKAVERYTQYYPSIGWVDLATQPFQRTYAYPNPTNPAYPILWLERVLYPLQVPGSAFAAPPAGPALAKSGTGGVNGTVQYAVTFLTPGGETTMGPASSLTLSNGQVMVTAIPVGPVASPAQSQNMIIGRNLYRTLNGGSTFFLLTCLRDNLTTSYLDTLPDSSLATMPNPPTVNTSGLMCWPPRERDFAEYSNLFDSSTALASGGNMGSLGAVGGPTQSTGGSQQAAFTLKLQSFELPRDSSLVMRVFYATRHQLDTSGSTIPEIHRDILVLGASAYAIEAYQTPTNDNFDFQDGTLRDRVNDTAIPTSWLATAKYKQAQFEQRLNELKEQRDFASSSRVHWGQIPARYDWL